MTAFVSAQAQIGDRRTDLAVGVNGGYSLCNIRFLPKINQKFHQGLTGGFTIRYTCEKYFNSICAIQAEVNINQMGWNQIGNEGFYAFANGIVQNGEWQPVDEYGIIRLQESNIFLPAYSKIYKGNRPYRTAALLL